MERDIVILTDGLTGGRSKAGGDALWTIRPKAVAWLPAESAADAAATPGPEGHVWRQDTDEVLAALGAHVENNAILRLRVEDGVGQDQAPGQRNSGDGTEAGWHWRILEFLEPVASPVLEALRAERLREVVVHHPILGDLLLNKDFAQYEGEVAWPGAPDGVELSLPAGNAEEDARMFDAASVLLPEADDLDRAAREKIADDYLELKNGEWADEDGREYTREEFISALRATELTFEDTEELLEWTLWFDDGGLFFGHGFTVEFMGSTPTDSCLVG